MGGWGVGLPYKLALFKVVTWRCATSGCGQYAGGRWVLVFGRQGDGCVHEVIWLDWHQEQPQAVLFRDEVFFVLFFFFIAGMLPRDGRGWGTKNKNEQQQEKKKSHLIFQPPDEPVWKCREESLGGEGCAVCDGCDETVRVSAAHFTVLSTFCHLSGHKFTLMCVPLLTA